MMRVAPFKCKSLSSLLSPWSDASESGSAQHWWGSSGSPTGPGNWGTSCRFCPLNSCRWSTKQWLNHLNELSMLEIISWICFQRQHYQMMTWWKVRRRKRSLNRIYFRWAKKKETCEASDLGQKNSQNSISSPNHWGGSSDQQVAAGDQVDHGLFSLVSCKQMLDIGPRGELLSSVIYAPSSFRSASEA